MGGDDARHAVPDGVYAFTEVDVDGCGTDATEYVAFDRGLPDDALAAARKVPHDQVCWEDEYEDMEAFPPEE